MLTGRVPFNDENPMNVLQMHLRAELPPLPQNVPYEVQMVVRKALAKDPGQRYQSAGEMMQHCQAVFAQVQGGGPSVGAAGVPKTMIAGMPPTLNPGGPPPGMAPPPQQYPGAPPPAYPGQPGQPMPGQFPGAPPQYGGAPPGQAPGGWGPPQQQPQGAAAKTMIAGQAPQLPPQQQPQGYPPQQAQGGYQSATPQQKTMMVGLQAPVLPPQGAPPPAGPPPGMAPGGPPPAAGGGPAKTVMLQASEGVVSVAGKAPIAAVDEPAGGASAAFWIVSMIIGIGVGVLAYVIMLQM
jgi:hypothetical protein